MSTVQLIGIFLNIPVVDSLPSGPVVFVDAHLNTESGGTGGAEKAEEMHDVNAAAIACR